MKKMLLISIILITMTAFAVSAYELVPSAVQKGYHSDLYTDIITNTFVGGNYLVINAGTLVVGGLSPLNAFKITNEGMPAGHFAVSLQNAAGALHFTSKVYAEKDLSVNGNIAANSIDASDYVMADVAIRSNNLIAGKRADVDEMYVSKVLQVYDTLNVVGMGHLTLSGSDPLLKIGTVKVIGSDGKWIGPNLEASQINGLTLPVWSTSGTNIYNNNAGSVGVGTSSPSSTYKLDVVGNTRLTGNTTISGSWANLTFDRGSIESYGLYQGYEYNSFFVRGRKGADGGNGAQVYIVGGYVNQNEGGNPGRVSISGGSKYSTSGTVSVADVAIQGAGGKVGVGTYTPDTALQVQGDVHITGDAYWGYTPDPNGGNLVVTKNIRADGNISTYLGPNTNGGYIFANKDISAGGSVKATKYCDASGVNCISIPSNCGGGQVLMFNGSSWNCATDTQCPPTKVIVDEASSGWDERAQYSGCTTENNMAHLSNVQICDAGTCRNIVFSDSVCSLFCQEFGFWDGRTEGSAGTSTNRYTNSGGVWSVVSASGQYAQMCKCWR